MPLVVVLGLFSSVAELPRSEQGHGSAVDACCACSHYLAQEPARVALCRYGPCGPTAERGHVCWDTVWDPSFTQKGSEWGSPCDQVTGWDLQGTLCWGGRSVKALVEAADAAGGHKHAASFPPLGSFEKCSSEQLAERTIFYGTLGGLHRNCDSLCRSALGESTHWRDGADQERYCSAVAAAITTLNGDGDGEGEKPPHVYRAPAGLAQPTFPLLDIGSHKCRVNADGTAGGTLVKGVDAATTELFRCTDAMCGFCKCMCGTDESDL